MRRVAWWSLTTGCACWEGRAGDRSPITTQENDIVNAAEENAGTPSEVPNVQEGVIHIRIPSSAQSKPVEVRILVPSPLRFAVPLGDERRFLYVLPVEKEGDSKYGDGLAEARRLELHEKY